MDNEKEYNVTLIYPQSEETGFKIADNYSITLERDDGKAITESEVEFLIGHLGHMKG